MVTHVDSGGIVIKNIPSITLQHKAASLSLEIACQTNTRYLECEDLIAKFPDLASRYAIHILRARWPKAEKYMIGALSSHDDTQYYQALSAVLEYVNSLIDGRWLRIEPYLMRSPQAILSYSLHNIKGRWLLAEDKLLKSPRHATTYATEVIKGRWVKAEQVISGDPVSCWYYAVLIGKRWKGADKKLSEDVNLYTVLYARDVIKGRWPEVEQEIFNYHSKSQVWLNYAPVFLEDILRSNNPAALSYYANKGYLRRLRQAIAAYGNYPYRLKKVYKQNKYIVPPASFPYWQTNEAKDDIRRALGN